MAENATDGARDELPDSAGSFAEEAAPFWPGGGKTGTVRRALFNQHQVAQAAGEPDTGSGALPWLWRTLLDAFPGLSPEARFLIQAELAGDDPQVRLVLAAYRTASSARDSEKARQALDQAISVLTTEGKRRRLPPHVGDTYARYALLLTGPSLVHDAPPDAEKRVKHLVQLSIKMWGQYGRTGPWMPAGPSGSNWPYPMGSIEAPGSWQAALLASALRNGKELSAALFGLRQDLSAEPRLAPLDSAALTAVGGLLLAWLDLPEAHQILPEPQPEETFVAGIEIPDTLETLAAVLGAAAAATNDHPTLGFIRRRFPPGSWAGDDDGYTGAGRELGYLQALFGDSSDAGPGSDSTAALHSLHRDWIAAMVDEDFLRSPWSPIMHASVLVAALRRHGQEQSAQAVAWDTIQSQQLVPTPLEQRLHRMLRVIAAAPVDAKGPSRFSQAADALYSALLDGAAPTSSELRRLRLGVQLLIRRPTPRIRPAQSR
jgi:hypothetical protein